MCRPLRDQFNDMQTPSSFDDESVCGFVPTNHEYVQTPSSFNDMHHIIMGLR